MTAKGLSISLQLVFAPALLVCGLNARAEPSEVDLAGQTGRFQFLRNSSEAPALMKTGSTHRGRGREFDPPLGRREARRITRCGSGARTHGLRRILGRSGASRVRLGQCRRSRGAERHKDHPALLDECVAQAEFLTLLQRFSGAGAPANPKEPMFDFRVHLITLRPWKRRLLA